MSNDENRVIVVGSGPSGAMAAFALAQRGVSVLVLEAGDSMPGGLLVRAFGRTVFKRRGTGLAPVPVVASGDEGAVWYSELAPGGLSNHWTGAVPRYAPEDFEDGSPLGDEYRWPVTYDQLAPYYARVERLLTISGTATDYPAAPAGIVKYRIQLPLAWEKIARRVALQGSGLLPAPLAAGRSWGIHRGETAFNSFVALLQPWILRKRVMFRRNVRVLRLHIDALGSPAVECTDVRSGGQFGFKCAAVVLACGAINTPRVLLQSTSNAHPNGLGNAEGVLGAYLHDHTHSFFSFKLARPLPRLRHIAILSREPYATSAPLSAAQVSLGARTSAWDRYLSGISRPSDVVAGVAFGTMLPLRSNRVRLLYPNTSSQPNEPIDIHLRYPDAALATAERAVTRTAEILDAAGLSPSFAQHSQSLTPGSSVHYGGTARMHQSPEFGVIDGSGALHECNRVVVVDSSAFTTCVEKNPTLTAMALAARAADHLVERLAGSRATGGGG